MALAQRLALKGVELREVDAGDARLLGAAAVRLHADAQTVEALANTLANEGLADLTDVSRSDDVAIASDGSFVLARPLDEKVHRWDLREERPDVSVPDFKVSSVDQMAMSADGRAVVTAEDFDGVTLWDLGERKRPRKVVFLPLGESFDEIVLSRDGTTALIAYDDLSDDLNIVIVEVWDFRRLSHPARRSTLKVPGDFLYNIAISADGKTAVVVGGEGFLVWDLTDLAHPAELYADDQGEESVALSPDGRRAVFGTGNAAEVWDLSDRTKPVRVATMGGEFHDVFAVAMARKGDLVLTADYRGRAILWDLSEPSRPVRLAALKTGVRAVHAVALSDDGRTAVMGSAWSGPRVWDLSHVGQDPLKSVCRRGEYVIPREFWDRYTDGQGSAYADGDGDFRPCDGVLAR
ncbi:WD40 repeat domain-containing protein [Nonomuraea sp. NPDC003709]|uniref:WD40 repeat domain-containing protein n=1 Tax=Nonomuraea sp. NPDC003709 TaxID=3154450 RepID=UPI0033BD5862